MTSFDANVYSALFATNPAAAQTYLAAATAQASEDPVLARGTLEDYLNQPQMGGGGKSITSYFNGKPQGSWLQFTVRRDLNANDVRQQTDLQGKPLTYRNDDPKLVLIVPVTVTGGSDPSWQQFENGDGTLWLKGLLQEEFNRAAAAAGDTPYKNGSYVPRGGASGVIASAGERPNRQPGYQASKLYQMQYQLPAVKAAETSWEEGSDVMGAVQDVPAPAPFAMPTPAATPAPAPMPSFATGGPVTPVLTDPGKAALLARLQGAQA